MTHGTGPLPCHTPLGLEARGNLHQTDTPTPNRCPSGKKEPETRSQCRWLRTDPGSMLRQHWPCGSHSPFRTCHFSEEMPERFLRSRTFGELHSKEGTSPSAPLSPAVPLAAVGRPLSFTLLTGSDKGLAGPQLRVRQAHGWGLQS